MIAAARITQSRTAAAATLLALTTVGCAAVSLGIWEPAASARRVRWTTSTSVPVEKQRASRCAVVVENAAVTSAYAMSPSLARSTAPSANVTTSPVPDTRAYSAQVMENATVVSVNAMPVILETTVIARRKRLPVCRMMARSVAAGAAVCADAASALNQGHLGTHVKNVPPVQMHVEQRGNASSVVFLTQEDWLIIRPVSACARTKSPQWKPSKLTIPTLFSVCIRLRMTA